MTLSARLMPAAVLLVGALSLTGCGDSEPAEGGTRAPRTDASAVPSQGSGSHIPDSEAPDRSGVLVVSGGTDPDSVARLLNARITAAGASLEATADASTVVITGAADQLADPAWLLTPGRVGVHPVLAASDTDNLTGRLVLEYPSADQWLELGPSEITSSDIVDAHATSPTTQGEAWTIDITFTEAGGKAWTELTSQAACARDQGAPGTQTAIVVDDLVLTAPVPTDSVLCGVGITGNSTSITGPSDPDAAKALAAALSSPLPDGVAPINAS